jgi:hypothetical protein
MPACTVKLEKWRLQYRRGLESRANCIRRAREAPDPRAGAGGTQLLCVEYQRVDANK